MTQRPSSSGAAKRVGKILREATPLEDRPELMMPVSDEHAYRQIEIEAMRGIHRSLEKLADRLDTQGEALHRIDTRLTRIESQGTDGDLAELRAMVLRAKDRIGILEADKNRRDGAFGLVEWIFKNWPGVLGFFALIVIVLKSTGQI